MRLRRISVWGSLAVSPPPLLGYIDIQSYLLCLENPRGLGTESPDTLAFCRSGKFHFTLNQDKYATGDDVATNMISVNRSKCARLRFNRSSCRRCVEICPKDAVRINESGISIDEARCSGCMLCASVCLSGGLEPERLDIPSISSKLLRSSRPVLACGHIVGLKAHVQICCLGVLCEQYLALLSLLLSRPIQLNLSKCERCTNRAVVAVLQQRIESICTTLGPDWIVIVKEEKRLEYSPKGYDRRGFFSAIGEMTRNFISEFSHGVDEEVP